MMSNWSGGRIGRPSLRLDAAYCTLLGAGAALSTTSTVALVFLTVLAVAVDIAFFAGSQAFALRRLCTAT